MNPFVKKKITNKYGTADSLITYVLEKDSYTLEYCILGAYIISETDSYYQHPYKRGPINVPSNVRYAIAAIAYSHNVTQKLVSDRTVENAKRFFKLEFEN